MNTGYKTYVAFVLVGIALFYFGAVSFKNEEKNLGTWLFILSNLLIFLGCGLPFFKSADYTYQNPFRQDDVNVTHTHNHYYWDNRSNVVEGVETVQAKADGSVVTTRHVKKWN